MGACSVVSNSLQPWTVAYRAPLSIGFPRQENWNGLPFPFPEDLPNPGIEPMYPVTPVLAGRFFTTEPPGKPWSSMSLDKLWNITYVRESKEINSNSAYFLNLHKMCNKFTFWPKQHQQINFPKKRSGIISFLWPYYGQSKKKRKNLLAREQTTFSRWNALYIVKLLFTGLKGNTI